MARATSTSAIFEALSVIPKLQGAENIHKRPTIVSFHGKNADGVQENPSQTTRRLAIGLASLALVANAGTGISLAEDNGYWLTSPIPIPTVKNSKLLVCFLLVLASSFLQFLTTLEVRCNACFVL